MQIRYLLLVLVLFLANLLQAQEFVFPGDANQNGLVDQYDILPIGFAYGNLGPIRTNTPPAEQQEIIVHWSQNFPNGVNYIHADANGNGMVELLDFIVSAQNQGAAPGPIIPLTFLEGIAGTDPAIKIGTGQDYDPNAGITELQIPISIEAITETDEFNGIAFNLNYDPAFISQISFEFSTEWINANGEAFQFKRQNGNEIRIAVTRFGRDPVFGSGKIGTVNIIIIDDLVDLLESYPDTNRIKLLDIRSVQAFDGNYNQLPIVTDSIDILVNALTTTQTYDPQQLKIQVFPNPATDFIHIQGKLPFQNIECIDLSGRSHSVYQGPPITHWSHNFQNWKAGFYYLKIRGTRWQSQIPLILKP